MFKADLPRPTLIYIPPKRCTDDAISIALHTALFHLDKRNTYVRMLFIDYSAAFNTIVPSKFLTKLRILGLNTSLCNWILDFLMGRPQVVRVGNNTSATLTLNTGAPQGYYFYYYVFYFSVISLFFYLCIVGKVP